MRSLGLVNHLDFGRAFGDDPERATSESVADWLKNNWLRGGGGVWNYVPAMSALPDGFSGAATLEQALAKCGEYWHPHGRKENEFVIKCVWPHITSNRSKIYRRSSLAAPIGRIGDRVIYLGIRSPLIRVDGDDVYAVMPIFRKNYVPGERQTDLSLTTVREFCVREGYRGVDVELIRAVGINGVNERRLVIDKASNRNLFTSEAFDRMAAIYTEAVARLMNNGLGLSRPNFRGYRVMYPDEPSFPGM